MKVAGVFLVTLFLLADISWRLACECLALGSLLIVAAYLAEIRDAIRGHR